MTLSNARELSADVRGEIFLSFDLTICHWRCYNK